MLALDYLNRTVPDSSGVPDVGAFEYNSAVGAERPDVEPPDTDPNTDTGTGVDTGTGSDTATGADTDTDTGTDTGTGADTGTDTEEPVDTSTETDTTSDDDSESGADSESSDSDDSGGCGCAVAGRAVGSPWSRAVLLVLGGLLGYAGRRRRSAAGHAAVGSGRIL